MHDPSTSEEALGPPAHPEVRRCAKCRMPSAICVRRFVHRQTFDGFPLGEADPNATATAGTATEEFRCQACGASFELKPRRALFLWMLGIVFGWTALLSTLGGLSYAAVAIGQQRFVAAAGSVVWFALGILPGFWLWRSESSRRRAFRDHPIIVGASVPSVAYPAVDRCGERRCARCTGIVKLVGTTRHRLNGIPVGTTFDFKCSSCGRSFTTESVWGLSFTLLAGALLGGVGYLILVTKRDDPAGRVIAWIFLAMSGGAVLLTARRVWNAMSNPRAIWTS